MYEYSAVVLSVHDGDTAVVTVDLGCFITVKFTVRLKGINAPELRGDSLESGLASRDFLRACILGKRVIINTFKDKKEKYGRYLADIRLPGDTQTINALMVEKGFAVPFME